MSDGMEWIVRFDLPSGGAGPERVTSDDLVAEYDAAVVLLLREHYCRVSRSRAQAYSDAHEQFEAADVGVVAALPDTIDRAGFWRDRYDLSIPVLSDTATEVDGPSVDAEAGEQALADGSPRFDAFAELETAVPSLPAVGVLDTRSDYPRLVHTAGGSSLQDCPEPETALSTATDLLAE
jgi:peroxiredoxin Q/BCP